jgi:hypothetical protein
MVVEVLQLDNQSVVIPATWSGVQGSECQELGSWLDKWIVAKGFLTGHSSSGRFCSNGTQSGRPLPCAVLLNNLLWQRQWWVGAICDLLFPCLQVQVTMFRVQRDAMTSQQST